MESKTWWQKLNSNRLAQACILVLIAFYLMVIFADFIAPYGPTDQQPNGSLLAPSPVYWRNQQTGNLIGPHIYPRIQGAVDIETGARTLETDFTRPAPLRLFVPGPQYRMLQLELPILRSISFDGEIEMERKVLFNGIPGSRHLFGPVGPNAAFVAGGEPAEPIDVSELVAEEALTVSEAAATTPAYFNLMGTDNAARDVFSRLVHGGRISLSIGIVGILIAFPIGLLVGGISGYFGGVVDSVLMRVAEVIMTIPSIYLLVSLGVILPPELESPERFLLIVLIISFIGWAGLARIIRGQVLSIKERTFVQASKSMGGRSLHIILKHVLPQTATYVVTSATLAVPGYIISEAVLSLIGLGIQEPDPSWGNMLSAGTNASILILSPWLVWPPAILIVITVLCFNILGDGLRDALDPRSLSE